jgi:hypothetical protein
VRFSMRWRHAPRDLQASSGGCVPPEIHSKTDRFGRSTQALERLLLAAALVYVLLRPEPVAAHRGWGATMPASR